MERTLPPQAGGSWLTAPVFRLLSRAARAVSRFFRRPHPATPAAVATGPSAAQQQATALGFLRFAGLRAADLMTPAAETVWLEANDPPELNRRKLGGAPGGTVPVREGVQEPLGVVRLSELGRRGLRAEPPPPGAFDPLDAMEEAVFVPEGLPVLDLIQRFREWNQQLAVVVDDWGEISGVVTVDDVLRALVADHVPGAAGTGPA